MNNFDPEQKIITDPVSSSIFGGVLASDELPYRIKHKPVFYIVNTDPSNMPMQHWIVIYIRENVDYFYPLGRAPQQNFLTPPIKYQTTWIFEDDFTSAKPNQSLTVLFLLLLLPY